MKGFRLRRPRPALIVSVVALFVALGGTAYAGFSVPKNSVGTKQLKNDAVTTKKLKNGAVTGSKIANNTITGAKINLSKLGTVPSANHANSATSAAAAGSAGNATGLAGPLASGQTLTGTFGLGGHIGPVSDFVQEEGITFQIPLASAPALNYVAPSGPATAHCPGSFSNPTATPGQICLYAVNQTGASGVGTLALTPNKFGVIVFPTGVAANTNYEVDGNWAVTAP